jgi:hypothetical protein
MMSLVKHTVISPKENAGAIFCLCIWTSLLLDVKTNLTEVKSSSILGNKFGINPLEYNTVQDSAKPCVTLINLSFSR